MKRMFIYYFIIVIVLFTLVGCRKQGPQGEQGIQGPQGEQGIQGESGNDGTSLHTGRSLPSNDFGNNGDSYIDLNTWNFYVKDNDIWILEGNLKENNKVEYIGTEGLEFYPISETECAVSVGSAKLYKEIVIPSKYKHYTVTTIYGNSSEGGFEYCENLEKIILPDTLVNIGERAFYSCTNLKKIEIPSGVENIGFQAFLGCDSLESITIPFVGNSSVEPQYTHFGYIFGTYSYDDHTDVVPKTLSEVIITGGTSIDDNAFYNLTWIRKITLPSMLVSIGSNAFYKCLWSGSIVIPMSVTTIEEKAFSQNIGITIYCETSTKPFGWADNWFTGGGSIEWGYNIE